jgi:putative tryptophan/tyrosine transport system substrate-binding protein
VPVTDLQLLHDLAPQAGVIALLIDANNITLAAELNDLEGAVRTIGLNSVVGKVASELEIDAAFVTFTQQSAGALVVGNSPFFTSQSNASSRYRRTTRFPRAISSGSSQRLAA